ncbi:probable inactive shikimate kinase like 1, chloroplastic [Papaver somniferum]|uniref:probable inactive shikimate kinase like 1, chloroplastic n=1 Tax=Papaver somniferum TaxID=3469 RepID=UPI000E70548C|nr:probable inactive shikimate kinase like 1, chloroplastic [Papaver somniferum]
MTSLINSTRYLQFSSLPPFSHSFSFSSSSSSSSNSVISLTRNYYNGFHKASNSAKIHLHSSSTKVCSLSSTNEVSGTTTESNQSLELKNKAVEVAPGLKGTIIFLLGMKSTMKTNLGKVLADALRYYYFDSDSLVEEVAGGEQAARDFKESDEKGYRESETEVLKQLSSMGRLVVCAGDGAVQSSTNLSLVRYGISIWIDVPLETLAAEVIESGDKGPFTSDEVMMKLNQLYKEMKDGYATADGRISLQNLAYKLGYEDTNNVTTEDVALEVLKEIEKLTRVKKMMEEAARPF